MIRTSSRSEVAARAIVNVRQGLPSWLRICGFGSPKAPLTSNPSGSSVVWLAMAIAMGALCGCGATSSQTLVTASELPEQRRRPDGVAVDPTSTPPLAKDVAATTDGLVTLRTPVGLEQAFTTVQTFFQAIVAEDADLLAGVLTRDALNTNPAAGGGPSSSPSASLFWAHRFRRLDYTKLTGEVIYHENDLEVFRAGDELGPSPHPAVRTDALGPGDLVLRVPIATSRVGTDRLLGDEILVWLRRTGNEYKIYRLFEEFQVQ